MDFFFPPSLLSRKPVSAPHVSVQAQILNLLLDLQAEFHLTYLFVAHDLSVVEHIADGVAIMYVGKLVEVGTKVQIFTVPKPDPTLREAGARIRLTGEVADPANPPSTY